MKVVGGCAGAIFFRPSSAYSLIIGLFALMPGPAFFCNHAFFLPFLVSGAVFQRPPVHTLSFFCCESLFPFAGSFFLRLPFPFFASLGLFVVPGIPERHSFDSFIVVEERGNPPPHCPVWTVFPHPLLHSRAVAPLCFFPFLFTVLFFVFTVAGFFPQSCFCPISRVGDWRVAAPLDSQRAGPQF